VGFALNRVAVELTGRAQYVRWDESSPSSLLSLGGNNVRESRRRIVTLRCRRTMRGHGGTPRPPIEAAIAL